MRINVFYIFIFGFICFGSESAFCASQPKTCEEWMGHFPGPFDQAAAKLLCEKTKHIDGCESQVGKLPIFHFDQAGNQQGKRILVFSLFHGDEYPAGSVARDWMIRLTQLHHGRNHWRVIPIVNPDGVIAKTRVNGRGVDLNRNLPTEKWQAEASHRWEAVEKKDQRRFPGGEMASESEVKCVLKHIEDYKPDFIVSLHTPYGLLDFDGPEKQKNPPVKDLPWKRLGNYPGSLGRFMWAERSIPVLTVELKGNTFHQTSQYVSKLQDIIGTVAITAGEFGPKEKAMLKQAVLGKEEHSTKKKVQNLKAL
jgi:protein MpaA